MSCGGCGKKAVQIVTGTVQSFVNNVFDKDIAEYKDWPNRERVCHSCEHGTWLSLKEYSQWLIQHGIEVLKHFEDLTVLPDLPSKPKMPKIHKKIYCRKCKCDIQKKSMITDSECPLNRWPDNKGVLKNG